MSESSQSSAANAACRNQYGSMNDASCRICFQTIVEQVYHPEWAELDNEVSAEKVPDELVLPCLNALLDEDMILMLLALAQVDQRTGNSRDLVLQDLLVSRDAYNFTDAQWSIYSNCISKIVNHAFSTNHDYVADYDPEMAEHLKSLQE